MGLLLFSTRFPIDRQQCLGEKLTSGNAIVISFFRGVVGPVVGLTVTKHRHRRSRLSVGHEFDQHNL